MSKLVAMKMSLIILFSLLSLELPSTGFRRLDILSSERICPYEIIWNKIIQIESNNNPDAICIDVNGLPSVGIAQIQQSRVDDYNLRNGTNLTLKDCFDPEISKMIFMFYAFGDDEQISRRWNGGASGMQKESTKEYWSKVRKDKFNFEKIK